MPFGCITQPLELPHAHNYALLICFRTNSKNELGRITHVLIKEFKKKKNNTKKNHLLSWGNNQWRGGATKRHSSFNPKSWLFPNNCAILVLPAGSFGAWDTVFQPNTDGWCLSASVCGPDKSVWQCFSSEPSLTRCKGWSFPFSNWFLPLIHAICSASKTRRFAYMRTGGPFFFPFLFSCRSHPWSSRASPF